jgi:hypothetical protein
VKTNLKLLLLVAVTLLVAITGCDATGLRDWQFVQSIGGLALGAPWRDGRGHVLLPVRCDVSGTQTITVRPTAMNSALVCEPPYARVHSRTVFLTICTTTAASRKADARCPAADLGAPPAGLYSVVYLGPDGSHHPLGSVQIPR